MTNKETLNRIKDIEIEQLNMMDSLKAADNLIRTIDHQSEGYQTALEIYTQHNEHMQSLISEKVPLLLSLGFFPSGGLIDESLRETDLWKSIEANKINAEDAEARYSLCTNCPEFVTISKQCKSLGVFAEEYSSIESSVCPIGNW
jgi:hypothetical protein